MVTLGRRLIIAAPRRPASLQWKLEANGIFKGRDLFKL